MDEHWSQVVDLAARQHGVIGWAQLRESCLAWQVHDWTQQGRLQRLGPRVYRIPGAPQTWRQRAMAACLTFPPPVAVSGLAAARLWEMEGIATPAIEVTVPRWRSGRVPGVVTKRRELLAEDVRQRFAIPVTSVERTLVDLAGGLGSEHLVERILDDVLRRRLVTPADLEAHLFRAEVRRRHGSPALRERVARRLDAGKIGESIWEDRVYTWRIEAGLPIPVRQHQVVVEGRLYLIDLAYPEWKIAIEFQGFSFHGSSRPRFDRDQDRISALGVDGWIVVLVTSASDRGVVIERVRSAIATRAA
ncbi:MAG: hypothetical protein ACYC1D_06395 [Acidimicrobiales bacterium]